MFWTNFEKLCTEIGKSPNAVAAELGIPSGSITAWSKGTKPRNQTVKKIADYFGVTVQKLLLDGSSMRGNETSLVVNYDRIWELCKVAGKKRSYLSKAMGHSDRYLLDARKQNTNIKPDELAILASELNTTPEYLTGETDSPEIKKDTTLSGDVDAELKYIWDNIDDADREFLLANARMLMERRNKK